MRTSANALYHHPELRCGSSSLVVTISFLKGINLGCFKLLGSNFPYAVISAYHRAFRIPVP